jgi:hypothetical protein
VFEINTPSSDKYRLVLRTTHLPTDTKTGTEAVALKAKRPGTSVLELTSRMCGALPQLPQRLNDVALENSETRVEEVNGEEESIRKN